MLHLNVSSKQVGGDYYDVIRIDDENDFIVAIADVSGKGVPASLMMANMQAFLQVICRQEYAN
ncbi:MAG: SpoIIE family protein phosphatase [Ignavibacteriales bacterium]|nr:SpoIIE family protein phosphatase [Ignavibacteriales bacterium]